MSFIIAIDGPAGSGKGTVTKKVAERLGFINIDTGAMYRCVTLKALENGIDIDELEKLDNMLEKNLNIELKRENSQQKVFLNQKDVTEKIRMPEVDEYVAKYAAIRIVRESINKKLKKMPELGNIIMEGRDIGTAVFPNADVKIYLDASVEERAKRRYKQDLEKGLKISYEEVLNSIIERHKLETEREMDPLRKAEDAIYIDSSNLSIDEVVDKICDIVNSKMK